MVTALRVVGVYVFLVVAIWCFWKGVVGKRQHYTKQWYERFEAFFALYQEKVAMYDDSIYRSDKAYPVVFASIETFMDEPTHTGRDAIRMVEAFSNDWKYLQGLVPEDIGVNPLEGFHIPKRLLGLESLEKTLSGILTFCTLGVWYIWSLR